MTGFAAWVATNQGQCQHEYLLQIIIL